MIDRTVYYYIFSDLVNYKYNLTEFQNSSITDEQFSTHGIDL